MNDIENNNAPNETNGFFLGVRFNNLGKSYFFSANDGDFAIDEKVVVETVRGLELGAVSIAPLPLSSYQSSLELKPIIRKATNEDVSSYEQNKIDEVKAFAYCQQQIEYLGLPMRLISCEYTLDRSKVIFSYSADNYVDFRELLRNLASNLHTRIDLRQIGSRDKAKMIGGIGICGLPLCCATFLNEFDGISINRAKNQMLALNIPKLSGHCGKLICCLKFEDDAYTEARKEFPNFNFRFSYNNAQYRVSGINVLSRTVKIETSDDVQYVTLEDFNKIIEKNQKS